MDVDIAALALLWGSDLRFGDMAAFTAFGTSSTSVALGASCAIFGRVAGGGADRRDY